MNFPRRKNPPPLEGISIKLDTDFGLITLTQGKDRVRVYVEHVPQLVDLLNQCVAEAAEAASTAPAAPPAGQGLPPVGSNKKKQQQEGLQDNLRAFANEASRRDSLLLAREKYYAAAASLEDAKAYYRRISEASADYDRLLRPQKQLFVQIMPDLACFAGCREPQAYEALSSTLANHRSHIRSFLSGAAAPEPPPDFPDTREPAPRLPARPEGLYAGSLLAARVEKALLPVRNNQSPSLTELSKLLQECGASPWSGPGPEGSAWDINKETDELNTQRSHYLGDAGKMAALLRNREKDWDYIRLLCRAEPVLREIVQGPPEEDGPACARWHADIGRRLWEILPSTLEQRVIDLHWLMPDSPEAAAFPQIRRDFRDAEADWPGLYCTLRHTPETPPLCVIPGGSRKG